MTGILVEPRVTEDVDLCPTGQGKVPVYPDPAGGTMFSRKFLDQVRDLYTRSPDPDSRWQPGRRT